jgi:hypothetical protein
LWSGNVLKRDDVLLFLPQEVIAILKKWKGLNSAYFLKVIDCLIVVYKKLLIWYIYLSSNVAKYVLLGTRHVFRSCELRLIQKCCWQNITACLRNPEKHISIKHNKVCVNLKSASPCIVTQFQ